MIDVDFVSCQKEEREEKKKNKEKDCDTNTETDDAFIHRFFNV